MLAHWVSAESFEGFEQRTPGITYRSLVLRWIATPEKHADAVTFEKRLWDAADQLRANSGLKPQQYSGPLLGLIFLRFAEVRFSALRLKLEKAGGSAFQATVRAITTPFV